MGCAGDLYNSHKSARFGKRANPYSFTKVTVGPCVSPCVFACSWKYEPVVLPWRRRPSMPIYQPPPRLRQKNEDGNTARSDRTAAVVTPHHHYHHHRNFSSSDEDGTEPSRNRLVLGDVMTMTKVKTLRRKTNGLRHEVTNPRASPRSDSNIELDSESSSFRSSSTSPLSTVAFASPTPSSPSPPPRCDDSFESALADLDNEMVADMTRRIVEELESKLLQTDTSDTRKMQVEQLASDDRFWNALVNQQQRRPERPVSRAACWFDRVWMPRIEEQEQQPRRVSPVAVTHSPQPKRFVSVSVCG